MGSELGADMFFATVPELTKVEPVEKRFSRTNNYWGYCNMHFVN